PEAPVELGAQVRRVLDDLLQDRGVDPEDLGRLDGDGVARPLLAGDEARLAEDLAGIDGAERERAVGGAALDGDLAALQDVEVLPGAVVGEDDAADLVA